MHDTQVEQITWNEGRVMIAVRCTASIAPGKITDGVAFSHEVVEHVKEKHGTTLQVLMPIGGNPARIAWHTGCESPGQWEPLTAKPTAAKTYMEIFS